MYDVHAVSKWLQNHNTSPATNERLNGTWTLRSDYAAQSLSFAVAQTPGEDSASAYPAAESLTVTFNACRNFTQATPAPWRPFNHARYALMDAALGLVGAAFSGGIALGLAEMVKSSQSEYTWQGTPNTHTPSLVLWSAIGGCVGLSLGLGTGGLKHLGDWLRHPAMPVQQAAAPQGDHLV